MYRYWGVLIFVTRGQVCIYIIKGDLIMAVLCPRCGEYSSILDEHCKKCGFSIKNYLENRKKFGNVEVQATDNSSSSICVKEETTASDDKDKSDEIQENIMRLLSNVKIVPDENKVEENEKIESNVQSVLESALEETIQKNSAVKIVAKKVANDVIILPPNRVKVEIEASRDVAKKSKPQVSEAKESEKITDLESKVEEIKKEIVAERQATIEDVAAKVDKKVEQSIDKVEEKVEAKEVESEEKVETKEVNKEEKVEAKETESEEKKEQEALVAEDLLADRILRTDKQAEEKIEDADKQAEQNKEDIVNKDENTVNNVKSRSYNFNASSEDLGRFEYYSDGVLFNNFIEESRKDNEAVKVIAMVGGFLALIIFVVIFVTNSAIIGIF